MTDPWAYRPDATKNEIYEVGEDMAAAVSKTPTGEVSVTFRIGKGYDNISSTTSGSPEFIADLLKIENFDGKLSTILYKAIEADVFLQSKYEETHPGKA